MTVFVKKLSHHGLRRRRILPLDFLQLLAKLVLPDVIELSHAIDLSQCELAFAKIMQTWLAVVLSHILVGIWYFLIEFKQDHAVIYTAGAAPAAGAPSADPAAPAAGCCPGAAPGSPPATGLPRSVNSSPVVMSASRSAGVMPTDLKS